jgi:esterase/lipase
MKKAVYIIPGFGENTNQTSYQKIIKFFKARNFHAIPVKISWKHRTMSDYVEECLKQVQINKKEDISLLGFSFGAMIAFIASPKIKPKMLILCSLSPYFKEDIKFLKKSWKRNESKKRLKNMKNFSFESIAKKIKSGTLLIAGSKEHKIVLKRIENAHRKIKNSDLIIIQNARHNISQKEYLDSLQKIISKL